MGAHESPGRRAVVLLFLAVKEGHLEVVNALLEVGGRELVMLSVKLAVKEFQGYLLSLDFGGKYNFIVVDAIKDDHGWFVAIQFQDDMKCAKMSLQKFAQCLSVSQKLYQKLYCSCAVTSSTGHFGD